MKQTSIGNEAAKDQLAELDALKVIGCKRAHSDGFVCD
jgi:hypothetical protein